MRAFVARSGWLSDEGMRLDAAAYSGGGLAARDRITRGKREWRPLGNIAQLFNGPRFARVYIRDRERGTPFLSSSDILLADLKGVPLLSNAATAQMRSLRIAEGWTLISCSGTVGNTAYVRPEMDGMTASQHVMRAVPTGDEILPGFLFAFLSSTPGQVMFKQRTYGSIIQHVEPHQIADMPVPLPQLSEQQRVHDLVAGAAVARSKAATLLNEASAYFDALVGSMPSAHDHSRAVGLVRRSAFSNRLDAFHHVGWAVEAAGLDGTPLGDLGRVSRPPILKRIFVERGVPFVSGVDVFQVRVPFRQRLMRAEAEKADCLVRAGQILVQRSGQRYGLIGQPAYVSNHMNGWAAGEHLMRVDLNYASQTGRVFAFLRSNAGRRSVMRPSYGTSIPELNPEALLGVKVPPLPDSLARDALKALQLRERADADEERAIQEVESWLR